MISAEELLQIRFTSLCGKLTVEEMKIILDNNKLDIHYMEDYGFIVACAYNNLDMVKYLLDISMEYSGIKIDIHTENEKAFIWACAHGKLDTVKYLLDISVEYSGTPIDIEANTNEAFRSACESGHHHIAKYLIEKNNYKSALLVRNDSKTVFESPVTHKLNIHLYQEYAFRWMCAFERLNSLKFMVKHYKDIKIDAIHCDAMKEAIKNNYNDIVLYLLQLGGYHMWCAQKNLIYI